MKNWLLIIIGIIVIFVIGIKINSAFDEVVETFHSEHSLEDDNFVLISESISPNKKNKYYVYQFDNGGFGFSRAYWSVIKNDNNSNNIKKGIIPNGYKIIGWTNNNVLILEKWTPYYSFEKTDLKNGMDLNGVKTLIKI
jgi:hypothetical protein